ncbi:cyclin-dependent kinase 12-like isoform X3 [Chrysemys picta bellii]|uniref:cyclin-dependent kinase 12-like isoform X3 n=1 Tax=Chrysemys picta bellii TaxID=8478 RepID=UPI0032B177B7
MYAKRLKSDLVELCKQRRLRIGRLTKEQLIAQLEAEDRANELIPVSQGSSLANAAQAPVSVPAGSGQPAAEGFPRPLLPMPRGRVGRSPANTEGAVTPPASRGSPRRSSPASRGSSRRRSASVERNWLEWEKELKLRELEDREQQRQHEREEKERQHQREERQRQHEREENERQRQHEERQRQHDLELARLKGSEPPAAVSEGGPRTARSFDKCIMAPYKEGEDMDDFLEAFETACELHRVDPADRLRVLTPLLDPKSVALYRQLGEAEKGDYELFKKALLREFGLTPEMYRERFRGQDKTPEISYLQLAVRMERYASKWAGGAQTKEDLIKLLVLEQLYERCPSDLRLWLVDRKPENPRHAGQLADEFVKSRSGGGREEPQRNRPAAMQRESHPGTSQRGNMGNPLPRGMPSVRDNRPARGDPQDMSCYYCGRRGHVRAQCPKLKDRLSRPNPHRVNLVEAQTDEGQASHARGAGSLSTAQEREGPQASSSTGLDAPDSGFLVYTVGAGLSLRREYLVPLEVDGRKVNGYWDTGAEVTLARPEVVAPDQYNKTYGCPTCPNGENYLGFTDLRFSQGSVVTESILRYRVSNTSINATDLEQQLTQRLDGQNNTDGLELDNIRGAELGPNTTTPPPGNTTTPPPGNTTTQNPGNTTTQASSNTTTPPSTNTTTPPPSNTTTLPLNTTTPPPGNATTPPPTNATTPPPGNMTIPPSNNTTTPPPGNTTTPPPSNTTTLPLSNTTTIVLNMTTSPPTNATTPPPGNTTTPPPTNMTTPPPSNRTTPPPGNMTTAPLSTSITTPAPIHFSLSFRIVNWNFNDSLLDPSTSYYKDLYSKIQSMYVNIYGCPTCPNGENYLGFTDLRFSQGSVVTESVLRYRVSDTSISATGIEQQLTQRLDSQNSFDGLQLDSIRANSGSSPLATSAPAPLVPGWGIALLVLVCIGLVLSIVIFILLIVCSCRRRNRGKMDLLSSHTSYQPRSEYPNYHTYGRFSAPDKKQHPYNDIAAGNGTNAFYANPATSS